MMQHISVMLNECIEGLQIKDGGIYFDGTLGGAGHSEKILEVSSPNGQLVATDLDDYAIKRAEERLNRFSGRFNLIRDNFKNFNQIKEQYAPNGFDGILLDLGVSSFQIDDKERGFAYISEDAFLDMRMDRRNPLTAYKVVNEYSENDLVRILKEYGEEKFANRIANNIIKERKVKEIKTCGDLVRIVENSIPRKLQTEGHVAKRTFQAVRIEVNGELEGLKETIKIMAKGLKKGGRIAIISFHSLEDRAVKQAFNELHQDCICPKDFPVCVCNKKKEVEIITKHPILPSEEEMQYNKRSKSAKLRIAQKI